MWKSFLDSELIVYICFLIALAWVSSNPCWVYLLFPDEKMRTFIEWLISISIFCLEKPSSGKVGLRSKEYINSKQRLKFVCTQGSFTFAISIILKWRIRKREELALAQSWSFRFKLMYLLHVFACVGWRKLALCYIKFLYSFSARFLPPSNSPWCHLCLLAGRGVWRVALYCAVHLDWSVAPIMSLVSLMVIPRGQTIMVTIIRAHYGSCHTVLRAMAPENLQKLAHMSHVVRSISFFYQFNKWFEAHPIGIHI